LLPATLVGVDAEAVAHVGAPLHERTDRRLTQRNGTRDKLVTTGVGDLTVQIPKVRSGSFFPALWSIRRLQWSSAGVVAARSRQAAVTLSHAHRGPRRVRRT
jgi:transposase-like protein